MIGVGLRALLGAAGAGSAPAVTYAVWGSDVTRFTRSNGNLTIAANSGGNTSGARSDISLTTGKWYFEVNVTASAADEKLGVSLEATTTSSISSSATYVIGRAVNATGLYSVACDIGSGKIWVSNSSGAWLSSGDPVTGANPSATFTAGSQVRIAAHGFAYGTVSTLTLNAGASAFSRTPPSGYSSGWYS